MKKTLFFVTTLFACAAFSGCCSNKAPEPQAPMASEEPSAPIHHDYKGERAGR